MTYAVQCNATHRSVALEYQTLNTHMTLPDASVKILHYSNDFSVSRYHVLCFYTSLTFVQPFKAYRFLYVPPGLTFRNSTWCSICVERFVRSTEQTANFAIFIYLFYLFSRLFDVSTSSCDHLTFIFFFHLSLSFQSSSIKPFSPISPLIPSAQVALDLPRFLLLGGFYFITFFGNLPSSILWTCPYHFSCWVLISSKRDLVTFIFCLIIVFLILSFLEVRAERRQKSISVKFSFATVFAFKHHVSAAYVIVLLTIAWLLFYTTLIDWFL